MQDIKKWENRISARVQGRSIASVTVALIDNGTRRTPAGEIGTMVLPPSGTIRSPRALREYADDAVMAWCRRVGGGLARTVAIQRAIYAAIKEER